MFAANSRVIRFASSSDAMDLRRLAAEAGQRVLSRPVLIGEVDGRTAAAVSLVDLRVISDESPGTERLGSLLLMRARATRAHRAMPPVRERMIALLPWGRSSAGRSVDERAERAA
jgi:hypothetical protein